MASSIESSVAWSTLPAFPSDDGWPYPDTLASMIEPATEDELDLDALDLRADPHAFACLNAIELELVSRRYGFKGEPMSMKQLCREFGWSHAHARDTLGRALDKLRTHLTA
jgi:DNA-directed RNA polymerase sigma subunit (sigma70/sigma32)